MTDAGHGPPARVVRCPSCRAAVDATLQTTCPFCGADVDTGEPIEIVGTIDETEDDAEAPVTEEAEPVEPVEPVPAPVTPARPEPVPAAEHIPLARRRPARSPGLGTRVIALVVGIGLLAGIGLLQRFSREPDRATQATRRGEATARRAPSSETPPLGDTVAPVPTAEPRPAVVGDRVAPRGCSARTVSDVQRFHGFERERVGRWFDRLDRYSDHRLRIDGDRGGHARRDAAIERSRSSRLGSLDAKRDAARAACDPRFLF